MHKMESEIHGKVLEQPFNWSCVLMHLGSFNFFQLFGYMQMEGKILRSFVERCKDLRALDSAKRVHAETQPRLRSFPHC